MYSNRKNDAVQKSNKTTEDIFSDTIFTHSRILDEIAEVTRNNNIMNATEPSNFSNMLLTNSNNLKIFQNSKHVSCNQIPDQHTSVSIKTENDRYVSENSDDDENLFSCQVELIEGGDSYLNDDAKSLPMNDEMTLEQNQNESNEQINETPKIHLKTVDEINRKCIVSNYMDIVKKRRQEVNRRYYLKRKEQMENQRLTAVSKDETNEEKKKQSQCLLFNEVLLSENDTNSQSTNDQLIPEQDTQETMKMKNLEPTNIEIPIHLQDYVINEQYAKNLTPNFKIMDLQEQELHHHDKMLNSCEKYLMDSKRIRREINKRYYLKRKRKMQIEKGITERIVVKNEAYMRRKERNRRYYLKRKERMRGNGHEMDDSSNSQSSLQLNNYYLKASNELQNNDHFRPSSEFESKSREDNVDYGCMSNDTVQGVKYENEVGFQFTENYTQFTQNMCLNGSIKEWVEDQKQLNNDDCNYNTEENLVSEIPKHGSSNLEMYLEDATRKRQERNRRYYLKHKEKLKQQRLDKYKKDSENN